MKDIEKWTGEIHVGDASETLAKMPESSVHCCVTSPPYFGLRNYQKDDQIGLEETLDRYIESLVNVFDELKRVLRPDGSLWLNLGDTFAGSGRGQWDNDEGRPKESYRPDEGSLPDREENLPQKSKMLIPHRVAISLQASGWIVRSDAVWTKVNGMPHPVKDRLNESKEFFFHLVQKPSYWFDLDAIREDYAESSIQRVNQNNGNPNWEGDAERGHPDGEETLNPNQFTHSKGKNPGDIFEVTTAQFPQAHFAVMPLELARKPIRATCPKKTCGGCGRGLEWSEEKAEWMKDCGCNSEETDAGIALDPFAGTGTVCVEAKDQGKKFVGIDLNEEYAKMAENRLRQTSGIHGQKTQKQLF